MLDHILELVTASPEATVDFIPAGSSRWKDRDAIEITRADGQKMIAVGYAGSLPDSSETSARIVKLFLSGANRPACGGWIIP